MSKSNSRSLSKFAVETVPESLKAARRGDVVQFRFLVSKMDGSDVSDIVNAIDPFTGSTPQQCAIMKGHRNMVLYLLKLGADVSATDQNGWNGLHWAAFHEFYEIAAHLMIAGCNLESPDLVGITPVSLMQDNPALFNMFLQEDTSAIEDYVKQSLSKEAAPEVDLFEELDGDDMGSISEEDEDDSGDEEPNKTETSKLPQVPLQRKKKVQINLEKLPTLEEESSNT